MTYSTRLRLEALYNAKIPVKEIARQLGYAVSSVYYELKKGFYDHRNTDWTTSRRYSADKGEAAYLFNRTTQRPPLKAESDHAFFRVVEELIVKEKLSPSAALHRIKERGIPVTHVCHTTLYSYIEKGLFLRVTNKQLPYRGNRQKKHRKIRRAKRLSFGTSIELRPKEISTREDFGHWEMDSVIGKAARGNTLLVLTERKTRYEIILRSKDKTAASTARILNRLERLYGKCFRQIFKTITVDNGCEFSNPEILEKSCIYKGKRTKFYYCHSYSSWERGSNENANRIIRRFIPKGIPISRFSDSDIAAVQAYINAIPRAILGNRTAASLFENELSKISL